VPVLQHASASYVNIFDLVKPFTSEVVAAWTFNFELESEIYLTVFRTMSFKAGSHNSNIYQVNAVGVIAWCCMCL
jgi:hypothetical protein